MPVKTGPIAVHHLHHQAFTADGVPQRTGNAVLRHRHLLDLRAQPRKRCNGLTYARGHTWVLVGQFKTFAQDADPQPADTAFQVIAVSVDLRRGLSRIEPIGAGHDFQHQGVVAHVCGNGAGVIDSRFDGHDAGVGHQAVGRLHAVSAAEGGRDAD